MTKTKTTTTDAETRVMQALEPLMESTRGMSATEQLEVLGHLAHFVCWATARLAGKAGATKALSEMIEGMEV